MLEPVNTVLKAIHRLGLLKGDHVLVVGQGPIGLIFTRLLALMKMRVIATDLMEDRLRVARQLGAQWTAPEPEMRIDAAIVCAPSDDAVKQCLEKVAGGGKVLLFAHTKRGGGTPLDLATICVDEKDLIGSYSADFTLQAEAARWVFSRKLDVRRLITHTFPLAKTAQAIDLAAAPQADALKILVEPGCASQ